MPHGAHNHGNVRGNVTYSHQPAVIVLANDGVLQVMPTLFTLALVSEQTMNECVRNSRTTHPDIPV